MKKDQSRESFYLSNRFLAWLRLRSYEYNFCYGFLSYIQLISFILFCFSLFLYQLVIIHQQYLPTNSKLNNTKTDRQVATQIFAPNIDSIHFVRVVLCFGTKSWSGHVEIARQTVADDPAHHWTCRTQNAKQQKVISLLKNGNYKKLWSGILNDTHQKFMLENITSCQTSDAGFF